MNDNEPDKKNLLIIDRCLKNIWGFLKTYEYSWIFKYK